MNGAEILAKRQKAVPRGVANLTPVVMARAKGALVWDTEGKEYIDFAGGIGINNVGNCHPKVVAAVKEQADRYLHGCFHVSTYEPYVALAEQLNALTPCLGEKRMGGKAVRAYPLGSGCRGAGAQTQVRALLRGEPYDQGRPVGKPGAVAG